MKEIIKTTLFATVMVVTAWLASSKYYYYSPFYQTITHATAVIHPTKGNTVEGLVAFTQKKDGLHIEAIMSGLTPGNHGFHVHEFGDCACDDAVCAGSHFNPTSKMHGAPEDHNRHVGDFGNIIADEQGNVSYEYVDRHATLNGPHSIIGRTVIVHADADDLVTQPSGNAGGRVGCGVVGIAQTPAAK